MHAPPLFFLFHHTFSLSFFSISNYPYVSSLYKTTATKRPAKQGCSHSLSCPFVKAELHTRCSGCRKKKKNFIFPFFLLSFPTSPSCFSCSFFALAEEVLCIIHCARLSQKSFFFCFLIVAQELLYPDSHSLRVRHTGRVFLIIFLVHSKTDLLLFRFLLFHSRLSLFFFFYYNGQYISLF